MSKVRVGMISFAHPHSIEYLKILAGMSDVEIVGLADERTDRIESYGSSYGIPIFDRTEALWQTSPEAVLICSENAKHSEWTIAALRRGIHVLCEKPLGTTADEMQRMIKECGRNNAQLMTAFPCRYLPAVREAKAVIETGRVGELLAIKGTNRGKMPGGWFIDKQQSGGGAIMDHTVHLIDLMGWFMETSAEVVYAVSGSLFNLGVEDAGIVHVTFNNGVSAVIDPSWSRPESFPTWGDLTMEIVGSRGVLSLDAFAQYNEWFECDRGRNSWRYWGEDMNEHMLKDFIRSIRNGVEAPITGHDGMHAALVALAAYRSIAERRPVRVEYPD